MPEVTLLFYYHHVTYRTLCHVSGHLVILPWVLRIWESVFYSQAFFSLHSLLLVSRPPRGWQFNLKVSRVSCWYFRNSPGLTILFELQQSTKRVIVVALFKPYDRLILWIICFSRDLNPFHDKLRMSKALCFIHLAKEQQSPINFLIFIPLTLPAKILAGAYDFGENIVMLINIINKTHNIHDTV